MSATQAIKDEVSKSIENLFVNIILTQMHEYYKDQHEAETFPTIEEAADYLGLLSKPTGGVPPSSKSSSASSEKKAPAAKSKGSGDGGEAKVMTLGGKACRKDSDVICCMTTSKGDACEKESVYGLTACPTHMRGPPYIKIVMEEREYTHDEAVEFINETITAALSDDKGKSSSSKTSKTKKTVEINKNLPLHMAKTTSKLTTDKMVEYTGIEADDQNPTQYYFDEATSTIWIEEDSGMVLMGSSTASDGDAVGSVPKDVWSSLQKKYSGITKDDSVELTEPKPSVGKAVLTTRKAVPPSKLLKV